jgi:hypothetical protein
LSKDQTSATFVFRIALKEEAKAIALWVTARNGKNLPRQAPNVDGIAQPPVIMADKLGEFLNFELNAALRLVGI